MPVAAPCCHDAAPSAVFQFDAVCVWHGPAGEPGLSRNPFVSSAKEISMSASPGGIVRSSHVSPRVEERKSRVPATSAHTTVPDGAFNCAKLGSAIGVAEMVGDGDAGAVEAGRGSRDARGGGVRHEVRGG